MESEVKLEGKRNEENKNKKYEEGRLKFRKLCERKKKW